MSIGEQELLNALERLAKDIHADLGVSLPLSMSDRVLVAAACGYLCAKHMVYMKETYGFPLEAYIDHARNRLGWLRVDYGGLRHELLMIGISEGAVQATIDELRRSDELFGPLRNERRRTVPGLAVAGEPGVNLE